MSSYIVVRECESRLAGDCVGMKHPHSAALRTGRFSEPGRAYLLTSATADRESFFSDWRIGRLVALELKRAEEEGLVRSLAWVLMPDHLHWLCVLGAADLATVMRVVKSRSAHAVNGHLSRTGPVWQNGFHDRGLRQDEDLSDVARYTIHNPVRAGLASRVGDYSLWDAAWL